jgi:hypothetical protein
MDKTKFKSKQEKSDENNAYNKLLKLQSTLQEEIALRDIFFEDRDSLLKKIDKNCLDYYKMRISIQEIYDNKSNPDPSKKKIKYILPKPFDEIPQYFDPVNNLMYLFHDNNEKILKLIEYCPKEFYNELANFFCNYFYVNIFSSTFLNENLLTLIYLLLEKEIDKIQIKNENEISNSFLDPSNSFLSHLLRCLSRKDEVKSFLENILKKILTRTAGFLNNQKDNMFLGFDIKKIFAFLNGRLYQIRSTDKNFKSFLNLYTMEIKKSKLNLIKKKNKENEEILVPNKNGCDDLKFNFENNFYVQATKETFDNLLLGNDENGNSDGDDDASSDDEDETPIKKKLPLGGRLNKAKDDFEIFLVNSGFYIKVKDSFEEEKNKKEIIKNNDIFNEVYTKELNKETLLELIDREDDRDMEEYLLKQLEVIQKNEKGNVFTNTKLINEIIHLGISSKELEKIILVYKYHFECVKLFIDELFTSLVQNKENFPYMIRAICTIISKLFSSKFKNVSNILGVKIISEFLFNNLIIPILENPQFNGTLIFDFTKDKNRKFKINTTVKVLQKLLNGEFYNSSINDEYLYTIFNPYFIEIMPFIFDFFREVSNSKLPVNIEKLLEIKRNTYENPGKNGGKDSERNIEFDFLKFHPEERLEHQSICLTFKQLLIIYNIIKSKEEEILGEKTGIFYKTYKKITFHEAHLKSKVENDEKNQKKTFLYFSKLILDKDLKEKMNSKKDQKLSFQTEETLDDKDNAKFILKRVKYSINTIIKHLNVLSRSNFLINNQNESTEDFIKGLNKMIKLEGFSEMLKENKLPLEWFGLYLQSNIENIPPNYKENNYALLYNELIEESKQNLLRIQNDDSLNTIYSKIINSEKMIDIGLNNLKRIINNEKRFEIFDFIKNCSIPILMDISWSKTDEIVGIHFREDNNNKGKSDVPDKKGTQTKKCKDISEFCEKFPNIEAVDIFSLEEELELPKSLNNYFQIVHNYMENEPIFNEYNEEEKKNIKKQIENFIHVQLYEKIYYKTTVQADNNIYYTIRKLNWIKPEMLNESFKYLDEKMINLMVSFINNMNSEMSPTNKLREFEKINLIINNIITLYGYDKSMYINLLIYVFIKGRPTGLFSTFRYIEIYLSEDMKKEEKTKILLSRFKELISKIGGFSEIDLVGFDKDSFEEKCRKETN